MPKQNSLDLAKTLLALSLSDHITPHAAIMAKDLSTSELSLVEFDYLFISDGKATKEELAQWDALVGSAASISKSVVLLLFASLACYPLAALQSWSHLSALYQKGLAMEGAADALEGWKRGSSSLQGVKVNWDVTIHLDHHERTVLPVANEKNILVTSALPYCNNVPHLGNIIGCVLSADVYARFSRLRGVNTLYICGTDEYGTATETKAIEEGVSCQELCDKYNALHKQTYDWFQIDFDYFGRTTTPQQTTITQDIYNHLDEHGHVFEDTVTQLYCEKHNSFLADRFVEGTCPLCQYNDARGDQCDKCGKLLNATDLINPHCKLDGAKPIFRNSKHLFLNLTEHQPVLDAWFKKTSQEGSWSSNSESITASWLKEGLKPRCITRDLKWGTQVPKPGFEDKVFYVWFDAPIGYLSITANYTPDWEQWWKNPDNVKLYQFIGKDNVPFHTVIFPSTLLGTKEPWTLLHHLSTTEYLQYESGKFSKSRGVGVFGNNVMDSGIPVEVWRYYLLSNRPETSDSQFTWNGFAAANNSELLANLGNFINRIVKFTIAKYDGVVPKIHAGEAEKSLVKDVETLLHSYVSYLENVKIRHALRVMMEISARGNLYLQDNKIDNSLFSNQRERCDTVVGSALNLCYLISALVYPYMPSTSASILRQLNLPQRRITDTWSGNDIGPGHKIGAAEYLFKTIDDKKVELCRKQYSSQGAVVEEPKKKGGKKASAPAAAPLPTTLTPEMQAVNEKITAQGLVVRQLKADKADPTVIKSAVELLLALKKELADLASPAV
ncbi:putative methionine--tRNA ligase, cytoplasmic protein rar1 [Kappamyces sp. JEL0829]|nr:putative methionine--tRNA ligase, cytoplasmic protein rar1 [Kappamyces sp. JEL0829]